MIISKPQVQDACRGPITYPKIKIWAGGGSSWRAAKYHILPIFFLVYLFLFLAPFKLSSLNAALLYVTPFSAFYQLPSSSTNFACPIFGLASLNFFWALASIYSLVTLSPTSSFCIKKQPKFPAHSLHQVDQPHECSTYWLCFW